MDAGISPAQQVRTHRHELRTLTYVTIDQANGGIVRNLTHDGIGAQVVAAVRPHQQLRVRFELRYPRLRIEARGEVMWATFSGQCGIRFIDLPPRMARQIDEWIFGNLLEGASLHGDGERPVLVSELVESKVGGPGRSRETDSRGLATERHMSELSEKKMDEEDDGLIVSPGPSNVIELPTRPEAVSLHPEIDSDSAETTDFDRSFSDRSFSDQSFQAPSSGLHSREALSSDNALSSDGALSSDAAAELDWLSRPLSGNSLAWAVNSLVVVAGVLLFALVFLVVTREVPKWPTSMIGGAAIFVVCFYWGFFKLCGGRSLGRRLARLAGYQEEEEEAGARFR
jgi:hypothetical protein